MTAIRLDVILENWPWTCPFSIAGHRFTESHVVVARLSRGAHRGCGEAVGLFYHGDSAVGLAAQIEGIRTEIESGISRAELRQLLPPGGARNALDCALWDLEAQQAGVPVWKLADLRPPGPTMTTYTIGAASPEVMAADLRERYRDAKAIKLKLLGDGEDAARVTEVRAARPDVWLGVDANQSLTPAALCELLPALMKARVMLIEQPSKVGQESDLDGLQSPIPLAADESVQSLEDLEAMPGRFDMVNIKLDKCGGLTEALMMARKAREMGLGLMVGNMGGTSLAMAPALLVGQYCDIVDLDGPLFLAADRSPEMIYKDGFISAPEGLWGGAR